MLFDLGSQRSYVTEELMKKLNLDVECNEVLNLNTFGSSKFAKVKCNRVTFFVSLNDYDDVEVSALTHKVICSPLRTRVDLGNHAHLRGSTLAYSGLGSNGKYFELVSTYESLSKRAKYHGKLLEHFSQRWRKKYLLNLLESFRSKQVEDKPMIKVGDIVILKNDQTKRAFWKLSRVIECFTGKDGSIRGAKVEVASSKGKKVLNRPIQHLVPLEVASQALCNDSADKAAASAPNAPIVISAPGRPKRNAALIGELRRQNGMKK